MLGSHNSGLLVDFGKKMRQIIPLYIILVHQILSNSAFGMSNSSFSIWLFLYLLSIMSVFLLLDKQFSYYRLIAVCLLGVAVGLWGASSEEFKMIGYLYVTLFTAYYVVSLDGLRVLKSQLTYIVIASALLSVIQIAGINELVHLWNSQFINEGSGEFIQKISIVDITSFGYETNDFDSRQVRAPGIFHSSAILSLVYVVYMAFVFSGFYVSKRHFSLIPWLIAFSGSKLVLLAALLMLFASLMFGKLSIRICLMILLNAVVSVVIHTLLFGALLGEQFSLAYAYGSVDARFRAYFDFTLGNFLREFDFSQYIPYVWLVIGLVFMAYVAIRKLGNWSVSYVHYIMSIGLISAIIATPQLGNTLFGLFYIPAFFGLRRSESTTYKTDRIASGIAS